MTGVGHRLAGNPLAFLNGVRLRITFLAAGDGRRVATRRHDLNRDRPADYRGLGRGV